MNELGNIKLQDIEDNTNVDFYTNFKLKLEQIEQFPSIYTFKFIVPKSENAEDKILKIFEHPSTKISNKESKTGKYNSLTIETYVENADKVIDYYKTVSAIDKVIML